MIDLGLAIDIGSEIDDIAVRLHKTRRLLEEAEELGFSSVWLGEGYPSLPGSFHLPSSLILLAGLANGTSLRFGTGVLLLPAWHPLRLAYDAAVLDRLTGGRLHLGVGLGTPSLWRRFGLPTERMSDRADEMLQALRALWRGEPGFRGELVSVSGGIWPLPSTPGGPPLWVGGRVGRSANRAARYGDGWYGATSYQLGEVARMARWYREACAEAQLPMGAVAVNRIVFVAETGERARLEAGPYVDALLGKYVAIRSILDLDGNPVDEAGLRPLADQLVIVGDPDEVCRQFEAYEQAGVTHIQARIWPSDMPFEMVQRTLRLLGKHVRIG